jgi:hydroxymethylpyrimidine pyrophosphatase-like HAD family hydrolase
MGKPYKGELERLPETFNWALRADLAQLQAAVGATLFRPIVAVGSGGSSAAAEFLATVHPLLTGQSGIAQTPLEFLRSDSWLRQQGVWLLSAGGRNIDIRRALKRALETESSTLAILCGAEGSPLSEIVAGLDSVSLLEFAPPAGKDGFLATNSLMAFVWLLARTYATLSGGEFPDSLEKIIRAGMPTAPTIEDLHNQIEPVINKDHLLVVFDPACRAVATDIESRFSEAALGSVKICDIRNFAHGRHHWLAKYAESSAVLGVSLPSSIDLLSRTLELLPKSVPRRNLQLSDDPIMGLPSGIWASMQLAGWRGELKGIDPGRPGVPQFGQKIYNLTKATVQSPPLTIAQRSIERKAGVAWSLLDRAGTATLWERHLSNFCSMLERVTLKAIVLDYDGTLVSNRARSEPPVEPLGTILNGLLARGVVIGIATGRGGSVRRDLQKVIAPKSWASVLIGYHNGAEISTLDDDAAPSKTGPSAAILACVGRLTQSKEFCQRINLDITQFQVGIQWKTIAFGMSLWQYLDPAIHDLNAMGLKAFASGHSVDIVEQGVSKLRVVSEIRLRYHLDDSEMLCIGDRGLYPGNDAELLSHTPSLSVDEVSRDAHTCWRLTPPSIVGPAGTAWYLSKLVWKSRGLQLKKGAFQP